MDKKEPVTKEFIILLITMIIGGLSYSIMSFAYMHTTFTTKEIEAKQNERLDRIDIRIEGRLKSIEGKLDNLKGFK